jgi:hypothetical protein
VQRAREHLQFVFDVSFVESSLQLAGDVGRDGLVGLVERVVELALDLVEQQVW